MVLNLPADIYRPALGGHGQRPGRSRQQALGHHCRDVSHRGRSRTAYSFAPILIGASLVPLLAVVALVLLVRNTSDSSLVRQI